MKPAHTQPDDGTQLILDVDHQTDQPFASVVVDPQVACIALQPSGTVASIRKLVQTLQKESASIDLMGGQHNMAQSGRWQLTVSEAERAWCLRMLDIAQCHYHLVGQYAKVSLLSASVQQHSAEILKAAGQLMAEIHLVPEQFVMTASRLTVLIEAEQAESLANLWHKHFAESADIAAHSLL